MNILAIDRLDKDSARETRFAESDNPVTCIYIDVDNVKCQRNVKISSNVQDLGDIFCKYISKYRLKDSLHLLEDIDRPKNILRLYLLSWVSFVSIFFPARTFIPTRF